MPNKEQAKNPVERRTKRVGYTS